MQTSLNQMASSSLVAFSSCFPKSHHYSTQCQLVRPNPLFQFRNTSLGPKKSGCVQIKASSSSSSMAVVNKNKKTQVKVFNSEEGLAESLAKYTAKFGKEKGTFTVVLSGGSLIKSLRKLAEPPYLDSIEWEKWHVFWVDERVVPKDHDDSNYKLAHDGFLSKVPICPDNVYSINDALSTEGAAEDYETRLKHLTESNELDSSAASATGYFPRFDLMLLGMGPDGHVASLFPGHPLLKEDEKWVAFIQHSPKPPPDRITFTFPVINSSTNIAMVVCGAGKANAVQTALGNAQNSDVLPVQMVSAEGELTWFYLVFQSGSHCELEILYRKLI